MTWHWAVRLLHWLGAALVLTMIAIGLGMGRLGLDAAARFEWLQLHKALGMIALAFLGLRLATRFATRRPPVGAGLHRLASLAHTTFYVLLATMAVSGWLAVSASSIPLPTDLFGLVTIPNLTSPHRMVHAAASVTHRMAGYVLIVLIVLHVAAALGHAWRRDGVFSRMLFGASAS